MHEGGLYKIWLEEKDGSGRLPWELVALCFDISTQIIILERVAETGNPSANRFREKYGVDIPPFYVQKVDPRENRGYSPFSEPGKCTYYAWEPFPPEDLPLCLGMEVVWPAFERLFKEMGC